MHGRVADGDDQVERGDLGGIAFEVHERVGILGIVDDDAGAALHFREVIQRVAILQIDEMNGRRFEDLRECVRGMLRRRRSELRPPVRQEMPTFSPGPISASRAAIPSAARRRLSTGAALVENSARWSARRAASFPPALGNRSAREETPRAIAAAHERNHADIPEAAGEKPLEPRVAREQHAPGGTATSGTQVAKRISSPIPCSA